MSQPEHNCPVTMENPGYDKDGGYDGPGGAASVSKLPIILYTRRWVILAIYSLVSMMNEVLWISLASVSTVLQKYYQVSFNSINWLSIIFTALYVTILFSVYILNRFGLRVTIVLGALCNALSSILRLVGYTRNGFVFAFIGNIIGGFGQTFLVFIPPTLASVWFGKEERARASAIGVLMNVLGVALGFLITTQTIPTSKDYNNVVKSRLKMTMIWQCVVCVVLFVAAVVWVHKEPPTPPTNSQALDIERKNTKHELKKKLKESRTQSSVKHGNHRNDTTINDVNQSQSTGFIKNLGSLWTNWKFHLMIHAYGTYYGLFNAINSLLTQMATIYFPGHLQEIGMMGFSATLFGLLAMMLAGIWLDKTHRYKSCSVFIFAGAFLSTLAFTLVLKYSNSFALAFVCYCCCGFFQNPYVSVGFEYLAELMYPLKESNLAMFSTFIGAIYGVILVNTLGLVVNSLGADYAGYIAAGIYFVGMICVMIVNGELKRYNVDKEGSDET